MSDRVAFTTDPALPATCVICQRSSNGQIQFADFNMSLDYYGAIVICEDCVRETVSLVDYVSMERHRRVLAKLLDTKQELLETKNQLEKYENVVVSLAVARPELELVTDESD